MTDPLVTDKFLRKDPGKKKPDIPKPRAIDPLDEWDKMPVAEPEPKPEIPVIIPRQLIRAGYRFILVKKRLKDAFEIGWQIWQTGSNYEADDPILVDWINQGGNYGVLCNETHIAVDLDGFPRETDDQLPKTFTVESGGSNESAFKRHKFYHLTGGEIETKQLTDTAGENLGHIKAWHSYVVGAGSIHPSGRPYTVIDESEVSTIEKEKLLAVLSPYIRKKETPPPVSPQTGQKKQRKSIFSLIDSKLSLSQMIPPGFKKNGDEWVGSHPVHGSTTGTNLHFNPKKGTWSCMRCGSGGGVIEWYAVLNKILDCSDSKPGCLRGEAGKAVIEKALEDGLITVEDVKDADLVAEAFGRKPTPTEQTSTEPEEDFKKRIKDTRYKNRLPPFPEIKNQLFKAYIEIASKVSYSLVEFHFAAVLALISMVLRRKVVINIGMTKAYANVFIFITGHTTISGKSVACNIALRTLLKAVLVVEEIAIHLSGKIIRGTTSEPGLIQTLNDHYNLFWYYDDCSGFFDDAITWNAKIIQTLCSIYDGEEQQRTLSRRGKGREGQEQYMWSCPAPHVSMLFNTTNKNIEDVTTSKMFSSGFFPRIMWFIGEGGTPRKNVKPTKEDYDKFTEIADKLEHLKKELSFVPADGISFGVNDRIEEWKINNDLNHLGKEDEIFRACVQRSFIHVYKIAVILSMVDPEFQKKIFTDSGTFPIDVDIPDKHAVEALTIVEKYLLPRMIYMAKMSEGNDAKNRQVMVLNSLNKRGGVTNKTQLLRDTRMDNKEMNNALKTLEESEEIRTEMRQEKDANKKTEWVFKL